MKQETEFLLKRASQEAALAIRSENNDASEAHQGMAIRYSARALLQIEGGDLAAETPPDAKPSQEAENPTSRRTPPRQHVRDRSPNPLSSHLNRHSVGNGREPERD